MKDNSMHYEGMVIRPPSEADSILLQVTTGCSHNKCTFCGVYRDKPFTIKDRDLIQSDLDYAARHFSSSSNMFLCDGDALIIPQKQLLDIFKMIRTTCTNVQRIGSYANAKSLSRKTVDDLKALRDLGLRIVHLGLESGDDVTLSRINKWGTSEIIIRECAKVQEAGINLFITVLLGIAGSDRSEIHAQKTGEVLSAIDPNYVGALSYMPVENTPLEKEIRDGTFSLLSPEKILQELRTMISCTTMTRGYFYANHASNYLPLRIRFPKDKASALATIDKALNGMISLTPEWMRGL
ncbi:MAG TPA: radical SAM protein [Chitinispirillaceae bacterium]|nr:radical SAM protein [Chitinispirillaceae bacterium]